MYGLITIILPTNINREDIPAFFTDNNGKVFISRELNIKLLDENEVLVNKNIELKDKIKSESCSKAAYVKNRNHWKKKALNN